METGHDQDDAAIDRGDQTRRRIERRPEETLTEEQLEAVTGGLLPRGFIRPVNPDRLIANPAERSSGSSGECHDPGEAKAAVPSALTDQLDAGRDDEQLGPQSSSPRKRGEGGDACEARGG